MLFHCKGIKEEILKEDNKRTYEIDILVDGPSADFLRTMFEKMGIIILLVQSFDSHPQTFGNIYATMTIDDKHMYIILAQQDLQQGCYFLLHMGFPITYISEISQQLPPQQSTEIIKIANEQIHQEQKKKQEVLQKKEAEQQKVYNDPAIQKTKILIDDLLSYILFTKEKVQGNVSGKNLRKLGELEEELKKVRLGTNTEKMNEIVEQVFNLIEEIEKAFLDYIKEYESTIFPDTVVTNLDIIRQYDMYRKSLEVRLFDVRKNSDDQFFLATGVRGIYLRLVQKDFTHRISNFTSVLYELFEVIQTGMFAAIGMIVFLIWIVNVFVGSAISDFYYMCLLYL